MPHPLIRELSRSSHPLLKQHKSSLVYMYQGSHHLFVSVSLAGQCQHPDWACFWGQFLQWWFCKFKTKRVQGSGLWSRRIMEEWEWHHRVAQCSRISLENWRLELLISGLQPCLRMRTLSFLQGRAPIWVLPDPRAARRDEPGRTCVNGKLTPIQQGVFSWPPHGSCWRVRTADFLKKLGT